MPSDYEEITRHNEGKLGTDTASRKSQVNMYSDFSHFVYEILQNADDYDATTVSFKLNDNELTIEHNGIPFKEANVKAISYFGKSTSREDLVKTGRFGLGFKSVFAFTASPAIHSGEENFKIYSLYRLEALSRPIDLSRRKTRIVLPFNHIGEQPDYVESLVEKEKAFNKISGRLKKLDLTTLLFTRKILEIKWSVQDKEGNYEEGHYLREDKFKKNINGHFQARRTEVTDGHILDTYLVYSQPIKWHGDEHKPIDVAFYLSERDDTEVICSSNNPLFVLFPTTVETHVGFLMNGPFRTPAHRETVSQDDEFNQFLIEEVASLLCRSLHDIRDKKLLTVSLLETLPIRLDNFPKGSMFRFIYDKVRETLQTQNLLPTADGKYISGINAKLARGEDLVHLLNSEQLSKLLKVETRLEWLTTDITDTKQDVYRYLIGWKPSYYETGETVEPLHGDMEIRPETIVKAFTKEFLQEQNEEWLSELYIFFSSRPGLWDRLKSVPFIRLQDGSHVMPFRDGELPNVFLPPENETEFAVVKREITKNKKVLEFLKNLGLTEPDIVEEVIAKILPEYNQSPADIPSDKHMRDMRKIHHAYTTVSQEKSQRLIKELKKTPFLSAENMVSQQKGYKTPNLVYLCYDDLLMYFNGNKDAWFVSSTYEKSYYKMFLNLGVGKEVSIERKYPNNSGYVDIVYQHSWHERGLNGFDPNIKVDGLEFALTHPSKERSLFIWNNIARPNLDCICGVVENSTRQTYEYSNKQKKDSANFGLLLLDLAWLPDHAGEFHKPNKLKLDDLPESFNSDEKLAVQLGMKMEVMAKLAEEAGVLIEDIEFILQYPEKFSELKANTSEQRRKPIFPTKTSANPERREEHIAEQLNDASSKEYEQRNRNVRTSRGDIDPVVWLKSQYTNESDQMVCQICKEEMPFKKRDGDYYFESVEIISGNMLPLEHEAQYLALCPLCAAKYKEFVKRDSDTQDLIRKKFINSDNLEIPIQLGEISSTISFVKLHIDDLKTVLRAGYTSKE